MSNDKTGCERHSHTYANPFPLMSDSELKLLAAGISEDGLFGPAALSEGKNLDGQNRWLDCQQLNFESDTLVYKGQPLG
jgi:hypothetical protein